jgi:hypothetical protein
LDGARLPFMMKRRLSAPRRLANRDFAVPGCADGPTAR